MAATRILILGVTGVGKEAVLKKIAASYHHAPPWDIMDFESDYLFNRDKGGSRQEDFLDTDVDRQFVQWQSSWKVMSKERRFARKNPSNSSRGVLLGLHGTYIRGQYGTRSVLLPHVIAKDFQPDIIITLIADVYDMWWRTAERAIDDPVVGRPTLEHLILGRRQETTIGDLIAVACRPRRVNNIMLSVSHPIQTVTHLIDSAKPRIVYLSFPISEPRRMAAKNDPTGIEEISRFVRQAYLHQESHGDMVIECPLAIDELPLREMRRNSALCAEYGIMKKFDENDPEAKEVLHLAFPRDTFRWPLNDLLDMEKYLGLPATEPKRPIPAEQIEHADGNLYTDVTFRDFRYVEQADCLAVYNPVFTADRDGISRSVQGEIDHALRLGKRVFVYQDPARDTRRAVDAQFGNPGTMAASPSLLRKFRASSPEHLLQALSTFRVE